MPLVLKHALRARVGPRVKGFVELPLSPAITILPTRFGVSVDISMPDDRESVPRLVRPRDLLDEPIYLLREFFGKLFTWY